MKIEMATADDSIVTITHEGVQNSDDSRPGTEFLLTVSQPGEVEYYLGPRTMCLTLSEAKALYHVLGELGLFSR